MVDFDFLCAVHDYDISNLPNAYLEAWLCKLSRTDFLVSVILVLFCHGIYTS